MLGEWISKAAAAFGGGYWTSGPAKLSDGLQMQEWFARGSGSHAGKSVTVDTALSISTVWACVRLISQTWGTLPVEVKEWDGQVMRPTRNHPLFNLLHDAPNADMSAVEFWSAMGVSLLTWGSAYAEITRVFDRVIAVTPLRPESMSFRRGDRGEIVYRYSDGNGARDINENDVLHIKYVTPDGLSGISPISQGRHSLGLAMAADETAGRLFANGLRVGGYVSAPQVLTPTQRGQAEELLSRFRGSSNAGLTPILEAGWKFENFSLPPAEAELLSTRAFEVNEVCRWYGVAPWLVGHTEKSTSWGTGLEQALLAFYTLTLRPILKNAEGAIKRKLIPPGERSRVEVDFNVEGLLRADSQGRALFLKTMVDAGIMTRNEARAKEGLAPLPGGYDLTVQSNQLPLSRLGEATTRADLTPQPETSA
jgi:HK97 family phage portal protein